MTRSPGYCGVILAAGTAERLDKSLAPWPEGNPLGTTQLSTHIDALNAVSELVLVVAGSNEAAITPTVYAIGGFLVSTSDDASDFASLRLGLHEVLSRGRDVAIVVPVDILPYSAASYLGLCEAYQASNRDVWAVVPKHDEMSTYPLVAGRELIEQILRASAESSLARVLQANAPHVLAVDLGDNPSASNKSEQVATKT